MTELLINMILRVLLMTTELPDEVINFEAKLKDPDMRCSVNMKGKNMKCDWSGDLDKEVINEYLNTIREGGDL